MDNSKSHKAYNTLSAQTSKPLIKILSIDGGGVRSIIPAYVIADLERRLPQNKKIAQYFDIIAGTSAGGIVALMLAMPGSNGSPKYSASYIKEHILQFSKDAFKSSFLRQLISGGGLWHVKYSEKSLQKRLQEYFGDVLLSQTVTNVIIPTYDIERDVTFFFKANRANKEPDRNCLLKDLAYATSAAPTYFAPALVTDKSGRTLTLVDGGISTNNPALAASVHAIELYGRDIDLLVVSIGTGTTFGKERRNIQYDSVKNSGTMGWMKQIVPLMMYASNEVIDYELHSLLNLNTPKYYFRIQTTLDKAHSEMDNITSKNLRALTNYAEALVQDKKSELDCIAKILCDATQ